MTHQDIVDYDTNLEWNNSRQLDVHRWSDYPEAHLAVNRKKAAYNNGTNAPLDNGQLNLKAHTLDNHRSHREKHMI